MSILSSIKLRVGFGVAAAALGGAAFALPATLATSGMASAGTVTERVCGDDGPAHNIVTIDTFCTTADPHAVVGGCPGGFTGSVVQTIPSSGPESITCTKGQQFISYLFY